ncbi:M23 family metallopeptidase [Pseudonocardia sp. EV170527-09]|uniref:M23 family metallopeptidase n=1 Tax=Pseudonocardia sp. EV170527-09 TaxID=2603411 RepID=UPI0011F3D648|nr:M23 family metallopeptidase [Pseudonocardia sp. EV170527-09]KAA1027094.1 M23 family metallopeptidase [Pseudonocardia sp. EV170527-09]
MPSHPSARSTVPVRPPSGAGIWAAAAFDALVAGAQATYDQLDSRDDAEGHLTAAFTPTELGASSTAFASTSSGLRPNRSFDPPARADSDQLAALIKGASIGETERQRAGMDTRLRSAGAPTIVLKDGEATVQPVAGRITSTPGPRWGTTHYGLDIANRIGTPIFAVADGTVERSGPARGFGLWVVIRHTDGSRSVYGHINRAFVAAGERVSAGERIAEVGNRGQSTGPHLHLEIREGSVSGAKVDPVAWLRDRGLTLR